jgi:hypothetical protein
MFHSSVYVEPLHLMKKESSILTLVFLNLLTDDVPNSNLDSDLGISEHYFFSGVSMTFQFSVYRLHTFVKHELKGGVFKYRGKKLHPLPPPRTTDCDRHLGNAVL